ncbi:hypothetical protein VE03_09232 [Pseudogymnoascus sp. 23342-1-I1]|nr:hypothetical protein VE03_09232 [Pseudogymnoascus sp. 23342-1-I1]
MEALVTPPRETQSSLRPVHRHHQDGRNFSSPLKTPMWRSEPATPAANTSRKRGREDWAPETPTSLPRRRRGKDAATQSVDWAVGDGQHIADNWSVGLEIGHAHPTTTGETVTSEYFPADEKQYIGFAVHWDADVIGVVCPFCMETEIHLMPRPSNTADVDLREPDCDPRKRFRLLFAGDDHPAVKSRRGIWVEERSRWESVYVEGLCSEESEQGSEDEAGEKGPICFGDQDHSNPMEILEDVQDDQIIIPSEEALPLAADTGLDLPIVLSSDDEDDANDGDDAMADEPIMKENTQILRIVSSLYNNAPPQYLTLGHGQAIVVYRPVAVIPVPGSLEKTVGFLDPTASSTRRVFTRSGWKGEEICDADMAWLQGVLATFKEAPWQELKIINNRDYTEKVRRLSAQLGLEPRPHNYDKENPVGQVCFSHVEKQLVVVALEEHQSSRHLALTEPVTKRTIYLDLAPCAGCLDFAKAVERTNPLRFEFSVMARVMGNVEKGGDADDSADESPLDGHGRQGSQRAPRVMRRSEKGEYEVAAVMDRKQSTEEGLQYLVRWANTWLTHGQLEVHLNGLYAREFEVVREMTRRRGEKLYLVKWDDTWMSYKDLGGSKKLIEEYENEIMLLD